MCRSFGGEEMRIRDSLNLAVLAPFLLILFLLLQVQRRFRISRKLELILSP